MMDFDKLWRLMDEFMECGMDFGAFEREFDRHFKELEQEFYRDFFHTLKKTIELCQGMECCAPPEQVHLSLIHAIELTPQKKTLPEPKSRRKRPKR